MYIFTLGGMGDGICRRRWKHMQQNDLQCTVPADCMIICHGGPHYENALEQSCARTADRRTLVLANGRGARGGQHHAMPPRARAIDHSPRRMQPQHAALRYAQLTARPVTVLGSCITTGCSSQPCKVQRYGARYLLDASTQGAPLHHPRFSTYGTSDMALQKTLKALLSAGDARHATDGPWPKGEHLRATTP